LAAIPLAWLFLAPLFWRATGSVLGWYLRRKTDGRRSQILEVMEEEERAFEQKNHGRTAGDDDEWETVEAYAVGSANNGEMGEAEWDGIVGFFHPFWYVSSVTAGLRRLIGQAMLEAEARGFSGLPSERLKKGGQRRSASCILEITTWRRTPS
jgi:hypothetical protein